MLSKVVMKRTLMQFRTVYVEHNKIAGPREIGRLARDQCASGEGFEKKPGDAFSVKVHSISVATVEDIGDDSVG